MANAMSWLAGWDLGKGPIPLDIYEEVNNLVVKAALPGLKPDEVNIQIEDDVLTISGASKQEHESKERNYQIREQFYGRLVRSVALLVPVVVEEAEAHFADGILTLTLPKSEAVRAKQISIKTAHRDGTLPKTKAEAYAQDAVAQDAWY